MSTQKVEDLSGKYPMRVVTRLTGLSADTIRVWERRYQAVTPERTQGGKRRYHSAHVHRLTQLRRATELGHTISEVACLSDEDLQRKIASTSTPSTKQSASEYESIISEYLEAIVRFDVRSADDILTRVAAILPPLALSLQFVVPLTKRVGALWCDGNLAIAQEHIVTAQLRSLLGSTIRQVTPPKGAQRIVVATPSHHRHEFGAFIGAFMAASRGMEPVYLGTDVPTDQINLACERSGAEVILLSIVRDCSPEEQSELASSLQQLGEAHDVWVGIPENHALRSIPLPVKFFSEYEELDAALIHKTS